MLLFKEFIDDFLYSFIFSDIVIWLYPVCSISYQIEKWTNIEIYWKVWLIQASKNLQNISQMVLSSKRDTEFAGRTIMNA